MSVHEQIYKTHLIVGMGEVGNAVFEILHEDGINRIWGVDQHNWDQCPLSKADVLHVCINYDKKFYKHIEKLWDRYSPDCFIIHSTVPVGTCEEIEAVHSPVMGHHPRLLDSLRIFVKYFGGKQSREAANIFERCGLKTIIFKEARITEALKLWSTTQYAFNIILQKEIYKWCDKYEIPFDVVYRDANYNYNNGYRNLQLGNYCLPILKEMPGAIGGHCVIPNLGFLEDNEITKFITTYNNKLKVKDGNS